VPPIHGWLPEPFGSRSSRRPPRSGVSRPRARLRPVPDFRLRGIGWPLGAARPAAEAKRLAGFTPAGRRAGRPRHSNRAETRDELRSYRAASTARNATRLLCRNQYDNVKSGGADLDGHTGIHLRILVTRPAPTVRPPSRMANFRPSSMAIGWISETDMEVLSPGMTISVPSGSVTTPVTSVVRK
jgi:hypothetical protein